MIRDTSAQRTIGGGAFLDLRAPARRRRTPERLAQLAAHAIPDPEAALAALLARPPHHLDLDAFARDRGLAPDGIRRPPDIVRIASRAGSLALSRATADRLGRALVATLEDFHAENPDLVGIGLERLRTSLEPRLPAPPSRRCCRPRRVPGGWRSTAPGCGSPATRSGCRPRTRSSGSEAQPLIGGAERFRPPRVRDLAAELDLDEAEVRRLCKLLARMGRVHEVAHDHFFLRDTVGEMVVIAAELDASRRPVLGRAVPRPARQRPQGRHPDPRVP